MLPMDYAMSKQYFVERYFIFGNTQGTKARTSRVSSFICANSNTVSPDSLFLTKVFVKTPLA